MNTKFIENIILIIGQNKNHSNFNKSLKIYIQNNKISKIIIVSWKDEKIDIPSNYKIKMDVLINDSQLKYIFEQDYNTDIDPNNYIYIKRD